MLPSFSILTSSVLTSFPSLYHVNVHPELPCIWHLNLAVSPGNTSSHWDTLSSVGTGISNEEETNKYFTSCHRQCCIWSYLVCSVKLHSSFLPLKVKIKIAVWILFYTSHVEVTKIHAGLMDFVTSNVQKEVMWSGVIFQEGQNNCLLLFFK